MAVNATVERFRKLTVDLQKEVHDLAVAELNTQAARLAETIRSVAPTDEGGLKHSVRVVPGKKDTIVRVVAGGQLTIRMSISAEPYDYARADEFGTVSMRARPFFFPTYRLMRKRIRSSMRRKITASIKKRSAV